METTRAPVLDERALNVFTDGSSYGSPRRGGYAFRIVTVGEDGHPVNDDHQPPGFEAATNQEMELVAVISALEFITGRHSPYDLRSFSKIVIYTDSLYVKTCIGAALYTWPTTGWCDRDGNPVVNAELWKSLVKMVFRAQPLRVDFEWVKGHKASPDNKAVDKLAKKSAKGPLNASRKVETVRRKLSDRTTEAGSIRCEGQRITLRVVGDEWLPVQKIVRYRCEVMSRASPYFRNVDWLFSHELLKAGHTYFVRLNDDPTCRRIEKVFHEVDPK